MDLEPDVAFERDAWIEFAVVERGHAVDPGTDSRPLRPDPVLIPAQDPDPVLIPAQDPDPVNSLSDPLTLVLPLLPYDL